MTTFAPRPIQAVAHELGLHDEDLELYGRGKAKIELAAIGRSPTAAPGAHGSTPKGRLILVTAIRLRLRRARERRRRRSASRWGCTSPRQERGPRAAGAVARSGLLGRQRGRDRRGGARRRSFRADDINLHFTGDIHAITTAHNLLSALVDNAIYFRDKIDGTELDPRQITWGRALDMNDRFLRKVIVGIGD